MNKKTILKRTVAIVLSGAMVLGVVVPWFSERNNTEYLILFIIGILATTSLAFFGYKIIKK